jgi:NADH-quinone oxidoreductase subunit A
MHFLAAADAYSHGSYLPILIMLVVATLLSVAMVAVSRFVGRRVRYPEKFTTYESGMDPKGDARTRFSVKFYLVAILFILFDIEVVFLYPWAVRYKALGLFGLVEMAIFLLILLVGYFYILGTGALDWDRRGPLSADGEEGGGR